MRSCALDHPAARETLISLAPASGSVQTQSSFSPPATKRERYTLTQLHAQGGVGRVWRAHDTDLNREVALKEIQPSASGDGNVARRFLKEAQVTGQLSHPGIVPVYELARRPEDNQPFYTMQFVQGKTMREVIAECHGRSKGGLPNPVELRRLLQAFISICQTIAYAHSRGVIHRDLKPENIVLGTFGEVLVLDWGLARMVDRNDEDETIPLVNVSQEAEPDATCMGQYMGTPAYMAPEQAEGRLDLIDNRTDIYGLGAILFEILAGGPPHRGPTVLQLLYQVAEGPTPRLRAVTPSAPPALDAICAQAMAKDRSKRYTKAADLAEDMNRWLADETVSAYRESPIERLPPRRQATPEGAPGRDCPGPEHHHHHHHRCAGTRQKRDAGHSPDLGARPEDREQRLVAWRPARPVSDGVHARTVRPGPGAQRKNRIYRAYTRKVNDSIDRSPSLEPVQIAEIQGNVDALAKYSPELARALRKNLELRLKAPRRLP